MIIDSKPLDNIITSISPKEAYTILNIQATFDKTVIQMNYHNLVYDLQEEMECAEKFAELRIAYEVLLIYIEKPEIIESIEHPIDVSYLSEGIKYLSLLQEIWARKIRASEREDEFWDNYYAEEDDEDELDDEYEEDNEEANSNAELNDEYETADEQVEIEIPDFGYPDIEEVQELLKIIENLHFNNDKGYYSGILAEAYYQMIMEGRIAVNNTDLKWHQWRYNYARKALDTDNSQVKDVEYLYACGVYLSRSGNIDSIKQAIGYLLEVEKRAQGTFREENVYYSLSDDYYYVDDYRNSIKYARKLLRCAPKRIDVYRIIGKAAYSQLEVSCNRMYADEAAKAFLLTLNDTVSYWHRSWALEMLCNICTRIRNWAMLEKLCGNEEDTILSGFPYHYYMGVALMNTKRAKEAAKHFHNALEINSERFIQTIYANLSRCYEEIDFDKACEYMRKFQQFEFNDINYPKKCIMHFYLRKKKYEEAKRCVGSFYGYNEINILNKFRIDLCQASSDEERKNVIEQLRQYMPNIQEREKTSEKNGYHVKSGGVWTEKNACTIGDAYWFILKDDEMAIRYYELSIEIVDYWLDISEKVKGSKYKDAKRKASYAHYMLTRIYGERGNKKKMQKHADAYMDYIREHYSDDDTKSIEEQYITALDDYAIRGLVKYADYMYIKSSYEMGTECSGDYNACKLAGYYIAIGKIDEARQLAVNLAKKYRKDIPALVYVLMGDLARVAGDRIRAERMYRLAMDKNPWEAYEGLRYL